MGLRRCFSRARRPSVRVKMTPTPGIDKVSLDHDSDLATHTPSARSDQGSIRALWLNVTPTQTKVDNTRQYYLPTQTPGEDVRTPNFELVTCRTLPPSRRLRHLFHPRSPLLFCPSTSGVWMSQEQCLG